MEKRELKAEEYAKLMEKLTKKLNELNDKKRESKEAIEAQRIVIGESKEEVDNIKGNIKEEKSKRATIKGNIRVYRKALKSSNLKLSKTNKYMFNINDLSTKLNEEFISCSVGDTIKPSNYSLRKGETSDEEPFTEDVYYGLVEDLISKLISSKGSQKEIAKEIESTEEDLCSEIELLTECKNLILKLKQEKLSASDKLSQEKKQLESEHFNFRDIKSQLKYISKLIKRLTVKYANGKEIDPKRYMLK